MRSKASLNAKRMIKKKVSRIFYEKLFSLFINPCHQHFIVFLARVVHDEE